MDSFYGGRQDLTAALGYELNGQTVILFRRKLNGNIYILKLTYVHSILQLYWWCK